MLIAGLIIGAVLLVGGGVLGTYFHAKTGLPRWK